MSACEPIPDGTKARTMAGAAAVLNVPPAPNDVGVEKKVSKEHLPVIGFGKGN